MLSELLKTDLRSIAIATLRIVSDQAVSVATAILKLSAARQCPHMGASASSD